MVEADSHLKPHPAFIVVAIITILVVGIAGPCRWSLLCLLCALAVNPRNSTKAGQGSIAHGMGMEHLPLD
jgi:hypothetical protein